MGDPENQTQTKEAQNNLESFTTYRFFYFDLMQCNSTGRFDSAVSAAKDSSPAFIFRKPAGLRTQ